MADPAARSGFYGAMAWALAFAVFVGFAPTFYLGFLFDYPLLQLEGMVPRPPKPLEHIHGLTATLWMGLFILQTRYVRRGNISRHRSLGKAGVVLGALMILQIVVLMVQTVVERNASGIAAPEFVTLTNRLFWGNLVMVVPMAGLLAMAYLRRITPEVHKRLMLLCMLCVLSTTLGRIARFELLGLPVPVVMLPLFLGFLAAPMLHDYRREQRVHPVYAVGCPVIFVLALAAAFVIPHSELARSLVALI